MEEGKKKDLSEYFDYFAGGRSLNAIFECDQIDSSEKLIMLYLGHKADFNTQGFVDFKAHKMETIAQKLCISRTTVWRHSRSLQKKGYLTIESRKNDRGADVANEFAMTFKIFDEWKAKKLEKQVDASKCVDFKLNRGGDFKLNTPGISNRTGGPVQIEHPINSPFLSSPPILSSPSINPGGKIPPRKMEERITKTSLYAALTEIYDQYAKRSVIENCVNEMLAQAQPVVVREVIRKFSNHPPRKWQPTSRQDWLNALQRMLHPPEEDFEVEESDEDELTSHSSEEPFAGNPSLDDCPY